MLPVLFRIVIPAGWGLPLTAALAVVVALLRAILGARAEGEGGLSGVLGALRADKWFVGVLALAVLAAWRAGFLAGRVELPIHSYGVLLALAFLAGVVLAQREAARRGLDAEAVGDLAFWLLVAGIAGSMVFYVLLNRAEFTGADFWADPPYERWPRVLVVWKIGLVFYGGFIGAALTTFFYMRSRKMPFLPYADVLVPSVAFGHFLGRLGCFCAGCCWGSRAGDGVPWAVRFPTVSGVFEAFAAEPRTYDPAAFLAPDRRHTVALHPVQLYEAFGELALFVVLVFLVRPRKRFHGQLFATWLVAYGLLRGVLELFRGDLARSLSEGLNSGQWTSAVILATGLAVWFLAPRPQTAPAPATV